MAKDKETKWRDTNAPTGLSIKRSGQSFACSWKIGDENYGEGQWFEWATHKAGAKNKDGSLAWSKWHKVDIGKSQVKKTVVIDARDDFLRGGYKLGMVRFRVCGRRRDYTTETEKKIITHKSRTSAWSLKTYDLDTPHTPSVKARRQSSVVNKTSFDWKTSTSGTSPKWFLGAEYQAVLRKNTSETDGKNVSWSRSGAVTDFRGDTLWGGTYAEHSIPITEQSEVTNDSLNSYTRFFRVRSIGASGDSKWNYARHVYAKPFQATLTKLRGVMLKKGVMDIVANWKSPSSKKGKGNHPIDQTVVEYQVATPASGMIPVDGSSWNTAGVIKDTKDEDGLRFSIDNLPDADQVVFVRVNNEHDRNNDYGINRGVPTIPTLANGGAWALSAPTFEVAGKSDGVVHIHITSQSDVPDSRIVVIEEFKKKGYEGHFYHKSIGAQTSKSQTDLYLRYIDEDVEADIEDIRFCITDYVADITVKAGVVTDGVTVSNIVMRSNAVWDTPVLVPDDVAGIGSMVDGIGTIAVTWTWASGVSGAVLSWADHEDAWYSTDEPDEYEIDRANTGLWNISGLETGKVWYVRMRFYTGSEDSRTYGAWSEIVPVPLKSAPSIPNLVLSKSTITEDDTVEASWAFSTIDGTGQSQALIGLAEEVDGAYVVTGNPIAKVGSAQHVTLSANDAGFENGNTYRLCVKVKSASGVESDWSTPAMLNVAEKPTVSVTTVTNMSFNKAVLDDITYTLDHEIDGFAIDVNVLFEALEGHIPQEISLLKEGDEWKISYDETVYTTDDLENYGIYGTEDETGIIISDISVVSHTANVLYALPMSVTAVGAGDDGTTIVSIRRVGDYRLLRPDESEYNGYDGEYITSVVGKVGEDTVDITLDRLVGTLDDGEKYALEVEVQDTYGQSAKLEPSIEFEVHWSEQAQLPLGRVKVTAENIALIQPLASSTPAEGDTFDIYRLSADKPELIFPNAVAGQIYVDPYPAIGEHGGHRIVYKTQYGDFITKDNERAIKNFGEDDEDALDVDYAIIDFDGMQIPLYYNVDVSNQWQKDFVETRYLGGSIQGDWNAGVSRSASVGTVMINLVNEDDVLKMRKLASHTGVCHLRTLDGSSFACDIQVSEERPHGKRNKVTSFSLAITRVDSSGYDGMTKEQWESMHGEITDGLD